MRKDIDTKVMKNILAKAAYTTATKKANSVCAIIFHQPKLPDKVKELRKF